jgi:molybdopterin-binding protein
MIRLTNVSKQWDGFALENINLSVKEGEYFVILGPTGAGKTLLLELLAGFFEPDYGKIEMFNDEVTDHPPEDRRVGFVYQDYMLFPHLNVFENIAFGLKLKKYPVQEVQQRVRNIAKTFGIAKLLRRDISTLSGGEAQRVALARALVLRPKVLLLDEPLAALDPNIQDLVRDEIKEVHQTYGITTIHVTHNREEAITLADRIAIIGNGKIYQVGSSEDVFRKPASRLVAEFVGVQNIFVGDIAKNGQVKIEGLNNGSVFTISDRVGKVTITLRPEDIIISPKKVKTSARNLLSGRISSMEDKGTVVSVKVDVGRNFTVFITKQALEDLGITIGSEVYLMFKASAIHVF